jgi:serine/threonine-protein kinase
VHRDVSPQNILVGIDGVSRITDFGVAHAATRLSSTRTGQLKGKLAYMAPEQARGAAVDRRSDVFAMGVVLWELLAGKRLFKASNDAETLHRILFAPVPTLRGAGVDVSIPLDTACMRALEREPENRYASAAEFADELERVGRSLGVLSTTREIASYLDGAVGAEISQQREVVRGWLSRSEPSRNERPRSGLPPLSVPRPSSRDVTVSAPHARTEVSSTSSAVLEVHEVTTNEPVLDPPSPGAEGAKHATERAPASRAAWVVGGACALLGAVGLGFSIPHSNGPVASSAPASTGKASAASPAPPASVPAMAPAPRVQSSSVAEAPDAAPSSAPPSLARPAPPRSAPPRRTPKPSSEDPDDLARNPYR